MDSQSTHLTMVTSWRSELLWLASAAVFAVAVVMLYHPYFFTGDDGAITLRYVERGMIDGGFHYSHERWANGASNPLWVLLLYATSGLFADYGTLMKVLAAVMLSASTLLVLRTSMAAKWRIPSVLFAGGCMLLPSYASLFFNGMESGLAFVIGATAIIAANRQAWLLSGVLAGLSVACKLDGLACAGAIGLLLLATRQWSAIARYLVGLLPTIGLSALGIIYLFGSFIPTSAVTKIGTHVTRDGFDNNWLLSMLLANWGLLAMPLVLAILLGLFRSKSPILFCSSWWLLTHTLAYSLIDLGDPYPWYSSVPFLLGIWVLIKSVSTAMDSSQGVSPLGKVAIWGVPCLALFASYEAGAGHYLARASTPTSGVPYPSKLDLARQAAGVWLQERSKGRGILVTGFGYPSLAFQGDVYDLSGLNSVVDLEYASRAVFLISPSDFKLGPFKGNMVPVAEFEVGGGRWLVHVRNNLAGYLGAPTSVVRLTLSDTCNPVTNSIWSDTIALSWELSDSSPPLMIGNTLAADVEASLCPKLPPGAFQITQVGDHVELIAKESDVLTGCLLHAITDSPLTIWSGTPPDLNHFPVLSDRWDWYLSSLGAFPRGTR